MPIIQVGSTEMTPDTNSVRWFALYTRANHEKTSAAHLEQRAVEHFLPTFQSVRRWKDRKKQLELPLFPGYLFARFDPRAKLDVLNVPGVVRLVGFDSRPMALPDDEIENLRVAIRENLDVQPHAYLIAGRRVRVIRGPLSGMHGTLVRRKGRTRLLVSIELIQRSAAIEVAAEDVELIFESQSRRPAALASTSIAELVR
jgi:transcription termination/antitermination protein NusG